LAQADVVIYDRLVPERLLDHAPQSAERIAVSSLPGTHGQRSGQIIEAMLKAVRQGRCVVRLKGGDPFLFGRGAEEAEALRAAGVSYEVVPGVTSGLACAAFAGMPLTHRLHASAVALVTGHECAEKSVAGLDWAALARFPGTLVFYMGMSRMPQIVESLIAQGKPSETPSAVIRWGTTGEQRTIESALKNIPAAVRQAGITPPALIVIGTVTELRPHLSWWERRPLFGKRVLVTRPRQQSAELMRRLDLLGAVAYALPTVEIHEPADWSVVDRALADLPRYDWLVFTSANGVHALIRRLREIGRDLRALGSLQLAAIGPATADALQGYQLQPDLVPPKFDSETFANTLAARAAGKRILLARADRGRELLRDELTKVAEVEQIAVYSQTDALTADSPSFGRIERGEIDYVTVTSSNIVRALHRNLGGLGREMIAGARVKLVSISPVTSATIHELGWPVTAEAKEATMTGLIEAMVKDVEECRGGARH
jgi:uroporphyrinogen III methyltransferase/synthase